MLFPKQLLPNTPARERQRHDFLGSFLVFFFLVLGSLFHIHICFFFFFFASERVYGVFVGSLLSESFFPRNITFQGQATSRMYPLISSLKRNESACRAPRPAFLEAVLCICASQQNSKQYTKRLSLIPHTLPCPLNKSYLNTAPINTCAPSAQSPGSVNSTGLCDTPSLLGTNTILVGTRLEV